MMRALEKFQHDGKWKQEQLWGEGNPQQQIGEEEDQQKQRGAETVVC
jgi:hypothetical protein